jgi:tRNA(adenine34) deaminase
VPDRSREDRKWMTEALRAARAARRRGEVPVGAVVVRRGRLLGKAGNQTVGSRDPSGHAEIVALRRAARTAGNHRLSGATLFVTLEPCLMCLGAMVQARIGRLVFGAEDPKTGAAALASRPEVTGRTNHRFRIEGGLLADECGAILRTFFGTRRDIEKSRRRAP